MKTKNKNLAKRTPEQRVDNHKRINRELTEGGIRNIRYALQDLYALYQEGAWNKDVVISHNKNGKPIEIRPEGDFCLWLTFGPCPPYINLPETSNGREMSVDTLRKLAIDVLDAGSEILEMFNDPNKKGGSKRTLTPAQASKRQGYTEGYSAESPYKKGRNYNTRRLRTRLQEETPDFFKAFQAGTYKSVTEAAVAAGLRQPGRTNLSDLRQAWNRSSAEERNTFKKWQKKAAKNENKINPEWK